VLAAITLPALLAPRGSVTVSDTVPALLAAAVAALLWRRTGSLPLGCSPASPCPSSHRGCCNEGPAPGAVAVQLTAAAPDE
jgi:hypothetical protein